MLIINEKYISLNTIFEDKLTNEAAAPENSRGKDLSSFLSAHSNLLKEITDFLCDEIYMKSAGYDDAKSYWQAEKGSAVNKYMIKAGTENGKAKICDVAPNVTIGSDDLATVLNKYINSKGKNKIRFIPDYPYGGGQTACRLEFINGKNVLDYVLFDIDKPTGKDALKKGGNGGAMELYIAFAYNKVNSAKYKSDDIANVNYIASLKDSKSAKINSKNEDVRNDVISYYYKNSDWLNGIAKSISDYFKGKKDAKAPESIRKLPNSENNTSEGWWGTDKTPKTDLISEDKKLKFSLKKADTGAQAMSGKYDESRSTIIKVLDKLLKDPDKAKTAKLKSKLNAAIKLAQDKTITDLKSAIKNLKESDVKNSRISDNTIIGIIKDTLFRVSSDVESSKKIDGWLTDSKETAKIKSLINDEMQKSAYDIGAAVHQEMSKILFAILESDDELKEAIVREAMTGEIKFGENSPATANYTLSWQEGKATCAIESIYDYIKAKTKYITSTINFKGSVGKSYSAMRLMLPKTTVDKELERIQKAVAKSTDVVDVVKDVVDDAEVKEIPKPKPTRRRK